MKIVKYLLICSFTMALVACGGGGGSPGGVAGSPVGSNGSPLVPPASIELLAGSSALPSGTDPIQITAIVKDSNNVGMANQTVTFSADSGNLTLSQQGTGAANIAVTNANGVATALLGTGANLANRNIKINAKSAGVSSDLIIPVTGTRIQATGLGTIKAGETVTYTVKLINSTGVAIANQPISLSSVLGNLLSNSGKANTDAGGVASFVFTAINGGADTLIATGLGASSTITVLISNIDLVVVAPEANSKIIVDQEQAITIRFRVNGTPIANRVVSFSATRGEFNTNQASTDANGQATVNVKSSSAGLSSVIARIEGVGQVVIPLEFIATIPASIALQSNPGAVRPNLSGSTVNQASIEAIVRDAKGNSVAGKQVNFTILQDPSNGTLVQNSALTDGNGRASVQYVPGANSSPSNGVEIRATVVGTNVSNTTRLTVNGESLFISIAFGNQISNLNETTYRKVFNVNVTDANGIAVGNKNVTLRVIPITYFKGILVPVEARPATATTVATSAGWRYEPDDPIGCPNEDINLNGSVDAQEDINGNGRLEPGNPVVASPGIVTTDANGFAQLDLLYGEQYSPWLLVRLEARATVGGTESTNSINYFLSGLASDFTDLTVPPAGRISPYGTVQSCANPN
jgi:hypothetical protein